jgi:RNA polymerase sigma factor (sigma-70 family)
MDAQPILARHAPGSGLPSPVALFGDERLARLVGSGSERAFAAIYDRYHQRLYRYCRSIVREDADAQDALQSVLTSAFVALQRGQRDAPLRPWLFRIAHNEAISLLRRRTRVGGLAEAADASTQSAEESAEERARLALLVADLHELPDRQRGALLMREFSGLSHEEIALALGTTLGTAKQSIFEARRALAEFTEGRSMVCEEVRRTVSDRDGRALRGRRVRAHLRDCGACAAFAADIPRRREDLHALAPFLAPAASGELLARITGAGSGHGAGGGLGATAAGAASKSFAVTIAGKSLLAAAVLTTAVAGTTGVRAVLTLGGHDTASPPAAHAAKRSSPAVASPAGRLAAGARASGSEQPGLGGLPTPGDRATSALPASIVLAHSTPAAQLLTSAPLGGRGQTQHPSGPPVAVHSTGPPGAARPVPPRPGGGSGKGQARHSSGPPATVHPTAPPGTAGGSQAAGPSGAQRTPASGAGSAPGEGASGGGQSSTHGAGSAGGAPAASAPTTSGRSSSPSQAEAPTHPGAP